MRRSIRIGAVLLSGFALIAPSPGGLIDLSIPSRVSVSQKYFDVHGKTWHEIRASLDENGPVDSAGVRRYASTKWGIRWGWAAPKHGKVDPRTVRADATVEISMPRLSESEVSSEIRREWNRFAAKMLTHEQNHLAHVAVHANEVEASILASADGRGRINPIAANAAANKIVRKIRRLDERYDLETVHGRNEGVELPR